MDNLFFNQDTKANPSKQKADTNKSNGNTCWWRTNERKDPNAMDVDTLTMEERGMLLRQGKWFRCRKTGHMAKDCPPEQVLDFGMFKDKTFDSLYFGVCCQEVCK
jgi:Zinc knuckle